MYRIDRNSEPARAETELEANRPTPYPRNNISTRLTVRVKDVGHTMRSSSGAEGQPTALPAVLTPVVGREAELDQLLALVDEPSNRLITLTGPGGVGKTRLALHLATTLIDEFHRDVVYVPLAAIRDAELVLPTIGQALEVTFDASDLYEERLVQALRDRPRLLLLDNFEQLLGAAPSVANLLARCPASTIMITSQSALAVPGEQLYPLHPLASPPPDHITADDIMRADAVTLFVARARAVKPDFVIDDHIAVIIADICRRLDGLPLAIELAATRMNILSPDALLARISNRLRILGGERRGVPDRLRTMRHAIAWSYDLLSTSEQWLFRRMSVFAGGFSLDAVEAVFQGTDDGRDAWTVLTALVDRSVVQAISQPSGETRFLMLETLRDYGLEQLDLLEEATDARLSHATWVLTLADAAEPHLTSGDQELWLGRLEPEWENIRSAMEWSLTNGHSETALRIMGSLWRFCLTHGHVSEGRSWLESTLDATTNQKSPLRTQALNGAGYLALNQTDLDAAQRSFEHARELAIGIGHKPDEHLALIGLGQVAQNRSDFITALAHQSRALDVAREIDDPRAIGIALGNMGYVSYFQGNADDAARFWEETRKIVNALGDHVSEATVASNLGTLAMETGDFERARTLLSRALELQRRLDYSAGIPTTLTNLADTWHRLGDFTLANDLFAEAVTRFRNNGNKGNEGTCLSSYALLAFAEKDFIRAASMILESTRLVIEMGEQFTISENADLLAEICTARGNYMAAVEILAASEALRQALGSKPKPFKQAQLLRISQALRQSVSEEVYTHHWRLGAKLDLAALSRRITIVSREIIGTRQPKPTLPEPEAPDLGHNLTNRELEVLRLLAQGRSTREISDTLFISPRTTTTHINNIFGKLEVSSRTAAVAYVMRAGLV